MKLVTFEAETGPRVGRLDAGNQVHDLTAELPPGADVLDVIERWDELAELVGEPAGAPRLLAPIPVPRANVLCVGKNYAEHSAEFARSGYDASNRGTDLPQRPVVFTKAPSAVVGPTDDCEVHAELTAELDYEAELAVVLGRGGRDIPRERAWEHVFGCTALNDVTARDLQRDHKQWFLGKSLDTACPMGPALVTLDEIPPGEVPALQVESRVNGELRQKAPVADLVFDVPELIATLSSGRTLRPGEIIATGTPAGVGIGFDPPRFLTAGDLVEVSISRIGTLRNRFH
jgi:2-keto-4-pentenoate hydratase/2-oxohepta-3-ene-1,7-dioic acid hydratase in catechol pathway